MEAGAWQGVELTGSRSPLRTTFQTTGVHFFLLRFPKMARTSKIPTCVFVALLLAGISGATRAESQDLVVGEPAPAFSLVGTDGKTYTNQTFQGRQAVVIAWFPKAFTGGCTKECQSFQTQGKALAQYEAAYFTASCDPVETNKEFAKRLGLDYVILSDPERKSAAAFGCLHAAREVALRRTYIIGKDGKLLHVDDAVKPVTHAEQVVAKLKELGIPRK